MKIHYDEDTNIITVSEIPFNCHWMDVGLSTNVWCKLIENGLEIHLNTISLKPTLERDSV